MPYFEELVLPVENVTKAPDVFFLPLRSMLGANWTDPKRENV